MRTISNIPSSAAQATPLVRGLHEISQDRRRPVSDRVRARTTVAHLQRVDAQRASASVHHLLPVTESIRKASVRLAELSLGDLHQPVLVEKKRKAAVPFAHRFGERYQTAILANSEVLVNLAPFHENHLQGARRKLFNDFQSQLSILDTCQVDLDKLKPQILHHRAHVLAELIATARAQIIEAQKMLLNGASSFRLLPVYDDGQEAVSAIVQALDREAASWSVWPQSALAEEDRQTEPDIVLELKAADRFTEV